MLLRPFGRLSVSISGKIGVRSLRALRLDTMSGKVLLLAVLAALITAFAMTLILSGGSQRSLGDRVGLELRAASSDAAREIDVWLDQRVFDLRLRASPYVVSDNLARASGGGRGAARGSGFLRTNSTTCARETRSSGIPSGTRRSASPCSSSWSRSGGMTDSSWARSP